MYDERKNSIRDACSTDLEDPFIGVLVVVVVMLGPSSNSFQLFTSDAKSENNGNRGVAALASNLSQKLGNVHEMDPTKFLARVSTSSLLRMRR